MQVEKTSAIIAHFIGYFDALTDEARLRFHHNDGRVHDSPALPEEHHELTGPNFASNLTLEDYEPDVKYRALPDDLTAPPLRAAAGPSLPRRHDEADDDFSGSPRGRRDDAPGTQEADERLTVYVGPGSTISHMTQVNLLQDDDHLDMTGDHYVRLDFGFTVDRVAEYADSASVYTPFSDFHRTDSYEGLTAIADDVREYAHTLSENGTTDFNDDAAVDFVKVGEEIEGVYINGELVEAPPKLDDFLPDRGLAATPVEPEPTDGPLSEVDAATDVLTVEAGANLVANIAAFTDTGIISPVMSVMGDYHQIDVITQAWAYSDDDTVDPVFATSTEKEAGTVAMNIASFNRDSFVTPDQDAGETTSGTAPVFPQYWHVSEIQGDVCFVKWIEQYSFVTDNDRLVVTTTGTETTVLTGGNTAIDFASFLGIAKAYDLVIVGGDVLDMNIISQLAVLYDNDWVLGSGTAGTATASTSGNLLWNQASITNVGLNDRFEDMPGYMTSAQNAIEARDAAMPAGLGTDPNFEGQQVLDVLYITGNLFDVTFIKQVNILGDADHVTQAASDYLASTGADATIDISTGANAVVNIAQIVDYDTFGATTYLGGNLYSDAVLIQGGLIEHDDTVPQPVNDRLANEVIAFLDNDGDPDGSDDGIINGGNDYSWTLASPADAMQTVLA